MIALTAAMALGLAGAAHSDSLVLKRNTGVKPLVAATPTTKGPTAGATKLGNPGMPDLVIIPYYNNPNGLPEGFPTESFCEKNPSGGTPQHIKFYIRNQGNAASGDFMIGYSFPDAPLTAASWRDSLAPGQQILVTLGMSSLYWTSGNPQTTQFSLHADSHNEAAESNEGNNQASSFCIGPSN